MPQQAPAISYRKPGTGKTVTRWTRPAIVRFGDYCNRWRTDNDGILKFSKQLFNIDLVPDQVELLMGLFNLQPGKSIQGVSAASGQGTGKTVAAAIAIFYKLMLWRDSLVLATGPKDRQLHDVLWAETHRLWLTAPWVKAVVEWSKTRIGMKGEAQDWQAIPRTATRAENMSGLHADHMLIVMEEASGVADDIHETLQGTCTKDDNKILMISQPTRPRGEFYRSHHRDKNNWKRMTMSSFDSPLVSNVHCTRLMAKWGKDSNLTRVRLLGQFPSQSEGALFQVDWLDEAKNRELIPTDGEPIHWGVDCARFGDDYTALVGRRGPNLMYGMRWQGADTGTSVGMIIDNLRPYFDDTAMLKIDEIGYGAGVVDGLVDAQQAGAIPMHIEILGVNVGWASENPDLHLNVRDDVWFDISNRYRQAAIAYGPEFPDDMVETLESELEPAEIEYDAKGRQRVEGKDKMRAKIGHSPDIADATMLAFYGGNDAQVVFV